MGERGVEHYMNLPYRVEVQFDSDGGCWSAEIPELPGFVAGAETWEELQASIEDAKRAWFEAALEEGLSIPEPARREEFSGRILVRMPKSLHGELTDAARRDGVSLNQWIVLQLAKASAGRPRPQETPERLPSVKSEVLAREPTPAVAQSILRWLEKWRTTSPRAWAPGRAAARQGVPRYVEEYLNPQLVEGWRALWNCPHTHQRESENMVVLFETALLESLLRREARSPGMPTTREWMERMWEEGGREKIEKLLKSSHST